MTDAAYLAVEGRADPSASRLRLLGALGAVPVLLIVVRLVHVQMVLPPKFAAAWSVTETHTEPIPARDGRILAADGVVLAADVARFDLEMHYRWLQDPPDPNWLRREALSRLSRSERRDSARRAAAEAEVLADRDRVHDSLRLLLGERFDRERDAIERRVRRMRRVVIDKRLAKQAGGTAGDRRPSTEPTSWYGRWWQAFATELTTPPSRSDSHFVLKEETIAHALASDVPEDIVQQIASSPRRYAGVRVAMRMERHYPLGDFAAHAIGYRRPDDTGTVRGQTGLERSYDRHLRGQPGEAAIVTNWAGEEQSQSDRRLARDGSDLTLTLHSQWQRAAETILDDAIDAHDAGGGCLILMDCWSGAIRVAASGPRVDLNQFLRPDEATWSRLESDPRRPLFPRLTQMALPPGSTMKLATAIAAVESGLNPAAMLHCQGYLEQPDRQRCAIFVSSGVGHGNLTLPMALGRSCNVFFYQLADRLGEDRLLDWAGRLGFGWTTGCDLPGESAGRLPRGSERALAPSRRRQLAIGQGEFTASPLQIVRLTAAIANGGRLVTPHFAEQAATRPEAIPGVTPASLATVREGMRAAVVAPGGTARSLARAPIAIAGKTGTAETAEDRSHAWFTGFLPADDPRFAVVAVLEHGGSGGKAAAPMVGRLLERIAAIGNFDQW